MKLVLILVTTLFVYGCASDDLRGILVGHPATYWGLPSGKLATDRQADLATCNYPSPAYYSCMKGLGYRAIDLTPGAPRTAEESEIILSDNTITTGLFAIDRKTQDIFTGQSKAIYGSKTASLSLTGLRTKVSCHGNATLGTVTATGNGSTGTAKLLCTDGRVIKATFVYESPQKGFGLGVDLSGTSYQFIFGKFKIDEAVLREAFQKRFKHLKPKRKELGA